MRRKRISFTIPAPTPETPARVHPNWFDPVRWRLLKLRIAYLDRLGK